MTQLEQEFPNLRAYGYKVTSPMDSQYNCAAYAADRQDQWWWPDPLYLYFWPQGVLRNRTLEAFQSAYATLGYEPCTDGKFEKGFEKVAIYAISDGEPKHVARQLQTGMWTSKLGPHVDIEHHLESLVSHSYGAPVKFLKRPTSTQQS